MINFHKSNTPVINVLYVSSIGEIGGVERFIDSVISHHNSEVVRPIVLTFQNGKWLEELNQRGISTYCIHDARLRQPFRVFREIIQILQKENINLVHSAYSWSHALILPAAISYGCDCIWMHHGPISDKKWQGFMPLLPSSLLLTNSHFMKEKLSKTWYFPQETSVVYYGLDTEEFAPDSISRQKFRNAFALKDFEIAVGIVGFIDTWKGQDIFLEAILQLHKMPIPIRAFIIGRPRTGLASERCLAFATKLHRFVTENNLENEVTFTGHLDIKDMGVMDGLDIVVHTSIEPEPFGMVLLEAMAKEKPIIASNEGGPREIITHQKDGLLIQPRSPEILAQAIKIICEDDILRIKLAEEARQTILNKFNPKITVNNLEKIYVGITKNG